MNEAVLDASVVVAWFEARPVRWRDEARRLRAAYQSGGLRVLAPPLIRLELMNVAGRRWGWSQETLTSLATTIDDLAFEMHEPDIVAIASWIGKGLTAYDAAYVAVAEATGAVLVTTDTEILDLAGELAAHITDFSA